MLAAMLASESEDSRSRPCALRPESFSDTQSAICSLHQAFPVRSPVRLAIYITMHRMRNKSG